jgi:hypothetical protein
LIALPLLGCTSCATVPKEVVELSYRVGQDLQSVQTSYQTLIHQHFDDLRERRLDYLNKEWAPRYVGNWVKDGRLQDVAKGAVVWSDDKQQFVQPTAGQEQAQLLVTIREWAQAAVDDIADKKAELLKPLDDKENSLTTSVNDAFAQLYRGNAAITAHLNSLRKVQQVQDDALAAVHLKDLRDKINGDLIKVSDEADQQMALVRKADGIVKKAETILGKKPTE